MGTKVSNLYEFFKQTFLCRGPGSSVNIVTGYGLDASGIESRCGGEIFRTCPDRPWGPPSLLCNVYLVFPGVKSDRDVTLTPHPLLVPLVMKEQSYTSTPPMGRTACTEPQCLYKGDLYLTFYCLSLCLLSFIHPLSRGFFGWGGAWI